MTWLARNAIRLALFSLGVLLFAIAVVAYSEVHTNHVVHDVKTTVQNRIHANNQKFCRFLKATNPSVPPTTTRGRVQQQQIFALQKSLGCDT